MIKSFTIIIRTNEGWIMSNNKLTSLRKILLPAFVGNLLEWYDLTLYGYFAVIFATLYFPQRDHALSIIEAYGIFAASYFMRPVGAIVFGYIGDHYGRKYSLVYSIIIMAVCSVLISILPTYQDWGIAAGVCLAIIRLLQGFAVGGEYSGAAIYLIESAPEKWRTFFGSLVLSSAYSGFLFSSIVGTLLHSLLTPAQLISWGWRIGFAFGGLIAVVGFYISSTIKETPVFRHLEHTQQDHSSPLKTLFRDHWRKLLLALGISVLPAGYTYMIIVFFTSYLSTYTTYSSQQILFMNTLLMLFLIFVIPVIGFVADKVGRRKVMLTAATLIILLCIPLFNLLTQHTLIILLTCGFLMALFEANTTAEIAGMFPVTVRYTGLALTLNLTNGIAGGIAPIVASYLIRTTGIRVSPMFYIIGLGIIGLFSLTRKYTSWHVVKHTK